MSGKQSLPHLLMLGDRKKTFPIFLDFIFFSYINKNIVNIYFFTISFYNLFNYHEIWLGGDAYFKENRNGSLPRILISNYA